jgi:adenosylcobinamide-phosphate synthase
MVFAPLVWFFILGPAGPALYRLALFADDYWQVHGEDESFRFSEFSRQALWLIDWLPLRITAIAFAVTGDFEDAVFCWRTQASAWSNSEEGILLASGGGALGVRLGLPFQDGFGIEDRPEMGLGDDADADFMQSTVGLVWRTLVLCLLIVALIWIAGWIG